MLRYAADIKSLIWMAATTLLFAWQWRDGNLTWWLYIPYLYFSVTASVMAHNHNHVRMWTNKTLNWLTDLWITLFYGFPVFGWIPTHNKNHHRYTNRAPDYTKTWRFWEANNLFTLLTYPTISSYFQQGPIGAYLREMRQKNRPLFWSAVSQIVVLVVWTAGAFWLDWKKALLFVVIPQQVSLMTVLVFNYVQHVHADEEDEWNHSRNITGWLLNFLMFNNGYHTVHHIQPGMHWSLTPAAHRAVAHKIDPALNERSFFWYLLRTYLLAPVFPALRRSSLRLARLQSQSAASA